MKYQIFVHIKDETLKSISEEKGNEQLGYVISHKGIYNSVKEGLDDIFNTYEADLKKHGITQREVANYMNITKIDPRKCIRHEDLFLNKK